MLRRIGLTVVTAVTLGFVGTAWANIEAGHPEFYENGKPVSGPGAPNPTVLWGQLHYSSAGLGSEGIECVDLGFGSIWNEGAGATLRGLGQVLGWHSSGHVPEGVNAELSFSCRPHGEALRPGSFITSESFIKSELNAANEVETRLRKLSTPWNMELRCGVRSEGTEYVAILRIGVPNSEFPRPPKACPGSEPTLAEEEAEVAEYKEEREAKKGCYATNPAPGGCINYTWVEPGGGLEVAWGGTFWLHFLNGSHNGLSASRRKHEGATSGEFQCEFPSGCVVTETEVGEEKLIGWESELIQAK
jgi:hypothetical protein